MKRILFIIPSLATGGTNSSLDSLYTSIKNKYQIRVFAISHQPRDHHYSFDEVLLPQNRILSLIFSNFADQKGVTKVIAFWFKIIRSIYKLFGKDYLFRYGRKVARKIETCYSFDSIIAFQEGVTTVFATFFNNSNKISWIHCNYDKYLPQGKSEEGVYDTYRRIVCVSQFTATVFANRYPALADRTVAIHNLIDPNKIKKMAGESIHDDQFVVNGVTLISVGRFSPVKRFREIPYIAAKLKKRGIVFKWYIIGQGKGEEFVSLKNNIIYCDVEDCVCWLGGKSNPYPFLNASDIYVCTSETEACPMVFKEAQVLGVPIVTTDFPSSHEFVRNGEGIITSFENISDSIAAMIEKVHSGNTFSCLDDDNERSIEQLIALLDS